MCEWWETAVGEEGEACGQGRWDGGLGWDGGIGGFGDARERGVAGCVMGECIHVSCLVTDLFFRSLAIGISEGKDPEAEEISRRLTEGVS